MSQPDTVYADLARLRDRVAELEAEIERRDRHFRAEAAELMSTTGLTISMARMLLALSTGRPMSRDQLAVLCGHEDGCDPRLVDSQIKRLRRRLPWLRITSLYGAGYVINGAALTAARDFMKGSQVQ